MTDITPLTQKARGIVAIKDGCVNLRLDGPGYPLMVIPGSLIDCGMGRIKWPVFARPCPYQPRHGFEESILVYDWAGVIELLQLARMADPHHPVELVLTRPLTGAVSAVATNAGVTWGRGNDGVTSGSDSHTLFIPVKTSKTDWASTVSDFVSSGSSFFDIPEFPYLEIVEDDSSMCLVQVRDGPEQSEGVNHVVRKMKVQRVLKAVPSYSLLDWEIQVQTAAQKKGTVIWAPGMSLASHFCVHGIESGIPVITDHQVKVGDVVQPTKNRTSALGKREYTKIAAQINEALGTDLNLEYWNEQTSAVLTAIATTQTQFCWGKEPHLLRLRSLSVAILLKAVTASCTGEIRHWNNSEGPRIGTPSICKAFDLDYGIPSKRTARSAIYRLVFGTGFTFARIERILKATEDDLGQQGWNSGFGGRRWAEVANTGIKFAHAAEYFTALPCATTWSKVVQAANRLINTSHNNGKCLTKWVTPDAMDMISNSPTAGFLNPYTPLVALEMKEEEKTT